ncbi:MAG: helix-turn-helix transcriptional regulator [Firmicutes bacterium]|nr:helix-turn-helix transcriptional regulator [Bacillota bacterium]
MTIITVEKSIGERLREARGDISQKDFGEAVGVSRSYVGDIEHGRVKPSLEYLINVAQNRNISLDWLLLGKESQQNNNTIVLQEAGGDPELFLMISYIRELWFSGDYDLRGWVKIQFKKAFPDYVDWRQKKQGSTGEGMENWA